MFKRQLNCIAQAGSPSRLGPPPGQLPLVPPGTSPRFPMHQNDNPLHGGMPVSRGSLAALPDPPAYARGLPLPRAPRPRPPAGCVTPAACSLRRPSPENSTKKLQKIFIDFSLFQLFSFLRLWELHHSEKPEFVSMNCLKDSSRDGLELEIQTSRPRKIAKRAFLVGEILVGIRFSVMSKIVVCFFFFEVVQWAEAG